VNQVSQLSFFQSEGTENSRPWGRENRYRTENSRGRSKEGGMGKKGLTEKSDEL